MTLGIPREGVRCLSCRAGLRCLSGLSDLMKLVVGETVPALAELPGQGPLAQPLPPSSQPQRGWRWLRSAPQLRQL